jgi:signal transduction histidine kinase
VDIEEGIPFVWADRARVSQVLLNLYSNAAKFTDDGVIHLAIEEVEDKVIVCLSDTGSGIPAGSTELIFEEFKQADTAKRDPRSGAGLGLAISRQLLTLMGGEIWVESELGSGSAFYFTLQPYQDETVNGSLQKNGVPERLQVSTSLQEKVS